MKINSIILKNELEFREYITYNYEKILNLFIFEDELENCLFFYCFTSNNFIVGAKENLMKPFLYYKEIYSLLSQKIKLQICSQKEKALKLTK